MSKSHATDDTLDLDAALDDFIKNKKITKRPTVSTMGAPIDMFGDSTEKKKPILNRILAALAKALGY